MRLDRRTARYHHSHHIRSTRYVDTGDDIFAPAECRSRVRYLRENLPRRSPFLTPIFFLLNVDLITDVHDANFGPTFLTVSVKPSNRILDTDLHSAPVRQRLKPLSHPVETKEGVVTHQFEVDGTADVCVRATKATAAHPLTFAWRIESSDEVPAILVQDTVRKMNAAATPTTTAAVLDEHLTHMERELQRITTAMSHVLKEADHNKDQDALFHQQTIAMHSATTFWPIVQVCVLLMTGFTQASHIVRFFKSRRII